MEAIGSGMDLMVALPDSRRHPDPRLGFIISAAAYVVPAGFKPETRVGHPDRFVTFNLSRRETWPGMKDNPTTHELGPSFRQKRPRD